MTGNGDVTGNEVTGSGLTGSCITSNEVTGSNRTLFYRSDVSVRENIFRAFFLTVIYRVFSSETPRSLLGNFWESPIGHSIFPAEISNLGLINET